MEDYRQVADALVSAGRFGDAARVYEVALEGDVGPVDRARLLLEYAWLLYEVLGQSARAVVLMEEAISLLEDQPKDRQVVLLLGLCHALRSTCAWSDHRESASEDAKIALQWLDSAAREDPDFEGAAIALCEGARLMNLLGQTNDSIRLCEKALQGNLEDRDRLWCVLTLTEALRREGRLGEAQYLVEETLERLSDPLKSPRLNFELALIYRAANRAEAARDMLEQLRANLRSHPVLKDDSHFLTNVHFNLGELYYESGSYHQAAEAFEQILRSNREDNAWRRNALLWLGHCYAEIGRYDEARACYNQVLASPNPSEAEKHAARQGISCLPQRPRESQH